MESSLATQCGACYAYAVVHAIAALSSLRGGTSSARVDLAELQAALCNADKTTSGCGGGWIGETYQYAMKWGILEADAWSAMVAGVAAQQCPRDAVEAELAKLLDEATRQTARAKQILGWERAPRAEFPLAQIVSNQPAVAIVHAPEDWKTYAGAGVYAGACSSDPHRANHAVLIVGYTDAEWIVQNSWGTGWGAGGYMRLPRDSDSALGRNPCGLLNFVTYPVLDRVTPERRGDLIQEGYCSGVDLVASSGGAGRTARQLAEHYNVPINDFLRINTHIPADPDAPLDVNTAFHVPPCTRNVPKPPLPTLSCGTTYHVSYQPTMGTATSTYDLGGAAGRRLRELHAAEVQAAAAEQAPRRRSPPELPEPPPRPPRPPGAAFPRQDVGPGAWRVIADMRGAFLSAKAAVVGSNVVFVAGQQQADGGPTDLQVWYLVQASPIDAEEARFAFALQASAKRSGGNEGGNGSSGSDDSGDGGSDGGNGTGRGDVGNSGVDGASLDWSSAGLCLTLDPENGGYMLLALCDSTDGNQQFPIMQFLNEHLEHLEWDLGTATGTRTTWTEDFPVVDEDYVSSGEPPPTGLIKARTLICSDGETEVPLDLQMTSMRERRVRDTVNDERYVEWRDIDCPGGFDAVRVRLGSNYVDPYPDLFFRCRGTGQWTSYTGGVGIAGWGGADTVAAPPDGFAWTDPVDPAFVAAVNETCQRYQFYNDQQLRFDDYNEYLFMVAPTPEQRAAIGLDQVMSPDLRSRHHLRLFAEVELEKLPDAAACPPGQQQLPYESYLFWHGIEVIAGLLGPAYLRAAVCRPWDDDGPGPPDRGMAAGLLQQPDPPPAPEGSVYLGSVLPPQGGSTPPAGSQPLLQEVKCPVNAYVTAIFGAGDREILSLLGVRCSDGSASSVGRVRAARPDAAVGVGDRVWAPSGIFTMEHRCPDGFDAMQVRGERLGPQTAASISTFTVHCDTTTGSRPTTQQQAGGNAAAGSPAGDGSWAQVGYPFWVYGTAAGGDNSSSTRGYTGGEAAFLRGTVAACGNDTQGNLQFVSSMVVEGYAVQVVQGGDGGGAAATVVSAVHVYCRPKPPPSADASFYDIALRYGITLRELLATNPQVDPSRGLEAYDNTTLQVPQRCAGTAVQPPVSTIAAVCTRRWPLPNTTVTGAETCGSIAQAHGLGLRGMRLCIQPASSLLTTSAPSGRRRMAQSLAQQEGCKSWRWVPEGATCDSLAAAHRLSPEQLQQLPDNAGLLDCQYLAVGAKVCVQDRNRGRPSPYIIKEDDIGDMEGGDDTPDPSVAVAYAACFLSISRISFTFPLITNAAFHRSFAFTPPSPLARAIPFPSTMAIPFSAVALSFSIPRNTTSKHRAAVACPAKPCLACPSSDRSCSTRSRSSISSSWQRSPRNPIPASAGQQQRNTRGASSTATSSGAGSSAIWCGW
ncbi:hypothetical protein HXX76_013419 [Chlamydomonas incerta]|uniref:Peptidase C1A papain C-terminal domain-containing protein n=1 Tax=Chlamydomonas incerta TaxID=51695 RepID=A0A835SPA9_CHLIN|nr:hypothetical protein HXX76_013419 [Chlamydomonas incerta]|eukprot:KAG2425794.1 hypothetical protein HXX76_013419 [Chlamydomonas incerta]